MSAEELRAYVDAFLLLGFVAGLLGAMTWQVCSVLLDDLAEAFLEWEERRARIRHARKRAAAQGDQARTCEGLDALRSD